MENSVNPQLQLAFEYVQYTGKNVFLTGKAGTGKTTFLHNLKKQSLKRMIVVAPTGVAAINAGGVTIHSFFQMAFGPIIPIENNSERDPSNIKRFSRDKINIIRSLDLLVIDEISMVRADLLDGIDQVLRRFKNRYKPFGGVQLLMIGDLQQLAPVIKDDEWEILRKYYDTGFFFSSRALKQTNYVSIELKHIYRQSDQDFINLLNKVRENNIDSQTLEILNKRYIPGFNPPNEEGYITLTTHNYQAQDINVAKLNKIPGEPSVFVAKTEGNFPEYAYPTDFELSLKVGAQVMFVKNDISAEKLFYNGKIGTIVEFEEEAIVVQCPGEEYTIHVVPLEWQNMKYTLNDQTQEIDETVEGVFVQFPLKLAWAITIHKSQGLTFEKAIIDARAAFAHGQVYVALSRCKTIEGMVLSTPISHQSIKSDDTVTVFTRDIEKNEPDSQSLEASKVAFQQELITDLFDFSGIQRRLGYINKLMVEHLGSIHHNLRSVFDTMGTQLKNEILDVNEKFKPQLYQLIQQNQYPEKNEPLQDRIKKASNYYYDKTSESIFAVLDKTSLDIDNKAVRKPVADAVNKLKEEVILKLACLKSCNEGFVVKNYLETRAKSAIEKPETKQKGKQKYDTATLPSDQVNTHQGLYKALKNWRNVTADELNLPVYMVLPVKTMTDLATFLPQTKKELGKIKGLGKRKVDQFGDTILEIIRDYSEGHNTEASDDMDEVYEPQEEKLPKPNTKQISFEMFCSGKSPSEIAVERGKTLGTIEEHLAYYVGTGELEITRIVDDEKIKRISDYFITNKTTKLGPAKAALGDDVSWGELRCVLRHIMLREPDFDRVSE